MELSCPECGEEFSPQGLSGHLRFKHNLSIEDAREAAKQAKMAAGADATSQTTSGRERAEDGAEDGAEFGEVSSHVRQRLAESADVAASMRMLDALDESDDAPDRSGLDDVERVVSILETTRELTDIGVDRDEIREAVRAEIERPVADGGGSDPLAVAVEQGADPEEIEALARATGRRGDRKWELLERVVDAFAGSPETIIEMLGAAATLADRRRERPSAGRQPRPHGPVEDAGDRPPAEYETYRRVAEDADDASDGEESLRSEDRLKAVLDDAEDQADADTEDADEDGGAEDA